MSIDIESVRAALREILEPAQVRELHVDDGRVTVTVAVEVPMAEKPRFAEEVKKRVRALPGVTSVLVAYAKAETTAGAAPPPANPLKGVRHIVAVGAGKGGVGKSTVAVNLAVSLARAGHRTGLLDADIYGPSVPILLGVEDGAQRVHATPEKYIVPIIAHELPLISFGFFLGEGSPAIWRGPMVSKAVKQFARGVVWPELDILVVDLPPGTGDVPLSLVQAIEVSGAIVVTQPQRLAAVEACKAGEMFATLEVPVLGVVENMTGAFGTGGGTRVANALDAPLLGTVPFDDAVIQEGDTGIPAVRARRQSAFAQSFAEIAQRVAESLGWRKVDVEAAG